MWTYDGILIEKKEGKYKFFSDDSLTFEVFRNHNGPEMGVLDDYYIEQIKKDTKEDGLYQAEVGYGPITSMQDPGIYWVKRIADVLIWERE